MTNIIIHDNCDAIDLPKWPALTVVGKRVTIEQAAEILIRTDHNIPNYMYGSNDKEFSQQLMDLFGVPTLHNPSGRLIRSDTVTYFDRMDDLRKRLGVLRLEYLANEQIVSCYVGGPHGWCNWSGDIFTNTYNIGKWPSVGRVADEWGEIAKTFPYLELKSQLFNGESCEGETTPLVEFEVKDGHVGVHKPVSPLVPVVDSFSYGDMLTLLDPRRERGISIEELQEKLENLYGTIPQFEEP